MLNHKKSNLFTALDLHTLQKPHLLASPGLFTLQKSHLFTLTTLFTFPKSHLFALKSLFMLQKFRCIPRPIHTPKFPSLCMNRSLRTAKILSININRHLHTAKIPSFCAGNIFTPVCNVKISSFCITGPVFATKIPPFGARRPLHAAAKALIPEAGAPDLQTVIRVSRYARNEAQAALLDYLHSTRSLQFIDAEHMSKNSPVFVEKILKSVKNEQEIRRSLRRYFRFHPINEFEPFFESLGLEPSDVSRFLPRETMFLSDHQLLMENFHVLCNYGVPRGKLGRLYKEATEVFGFDYGVLNSKIRTFEQLKLSKISVIKVVTSCPCLLVGNFNEKFVQVLEELGGMDIDQNWFVGSLSENRSYDWGKILEILHFFVSLLSHDKEVLGGIFLKNPGLLLDSSGTKAFFLVGLLFKFGLMIKEVTTFFLHFPQVTVSSFVRNMQQSLAFLFENEMEPYEIRKILCAHPQILGLCSLKRPNTVREKLNVGRKRLCEIIKKDPTQLKNFVLGSKISRLPDTGEDAISLMEKKRFLKKLGFVVGSNKMKQALKVFRGKGDELQERFDCLVKAGLKPDDVSNMIKIAPHVLNQSKDVIEKKIDFLVNGLRYPLESLVSFPAYMSYTTDRVKLRFSMYDWLKDEGMASPMLALSTILATSDKIFVNKFVNQHPKGPEVWEKLKKELCAS